MDATAEQLEQLNMKQHEWDRANEEERSALLLRLDMDLDIQADDTVEKGESKARKAARSDPDDQNLADPETDPVALAEAAEADATKSADDVKAALAAIAAGEKKAAEAADPLTPEPVVDEPVVDDEPAKPAILAPDYDRLLAFDDQHTYAPATVDVAPLQAAIDKINADRAELRKKVEEDELTTSEALAAQDEINARATAAAVDLSRAQDRNAQHQDVNVQRWNAAQDRFLKDKANAPIYMADKGGDPEAYALLSFYVQQLGANPDNVSRGFMSVLVEADKKVREKLSLQPTAAEPAAAPAPKPKAAAPAAPTPPVKAPKPAPRIPDTSKVPPNVGLVPQADIHQDDSPYAKLDRLEGEAYTRALAQLTPAQRAAYRESQG